MILRISHGYEVKEKDDPFVAIADRATEQFSLSTAPGGFLVDLIPASTHFSPGNIRVILMLGYSASYTSMVSWRWLQTPGGRVASEAQRPH